MKTNLFTPPGRNKTALDVEEELRFHIDMLEGKYTQHGMSVGEAKTAAARRFGNLERVKRQCVDIRRRYGLLRRVLKMSTVVIALTGIAIHFLSSDYKVARIGHLFIMIAIGARLLLYVRGLGPSVFFQGPKASSLSVITDTPDDRSNLREA